MTQIEKISWFFESFQSSDRDHITYYRADLPGIDAFKAIQVVFLNGEPFHTIRRYLVDDKVFRTERELLAHLNQKRA